MAETDPSPLAACPFCGGRAGVDHLEEGNWTPGCEKDDCIAFVSAARFATKREAIAAWNERPQPPAAHGLGDEIERLFAKWSAPGSTSADSFALRSHLHAHVHEILDALRSSQPDTREGFAAGIEAAMAHLDAALAKSPVSRKEVLGAYARLTTLRPTTAPSVDALVERLLRKCDGTSDGDAATMAEAADALLALKAEVDELRGARQREPYDLIAEGLWRLHVPDAKNWAWGFDVSQHYADLYRETARKLASREIVARAILSGESVK